MVFVMGTPRDEQRQRVIVNLSDPKAAMAAARSVAAIRAGGG